MEEYITRPEHDEFARRMEDEDKRQNRRIEELEKTSEEIHNMAKSLVVMCEKMSTMSNSIDVLNSKVETMESRDGEMWREVVGYIITCILGMVIGYIFKNIGM